MKLESKIINNWYLSRLIDSLENDTDEWYIYVYNSFTRFCSYSSKTYENDKGSRLRFIISENSAYTDVSTLQGDTILRSKWSLSDIPIWERLNPFNVQMRKYWKAKRIMMKLTHEKRKQEHLKNLRDSL